MDRKAIARTLRDFATILALKYMPPLEQWVDLVRSELSDLVLADLADDERNLCKSVASTIGILTVEGRAKLIEANVSVAERLTNEGIPNPPSALELANATFDRVRASIVELANRLEKAGETPQQADETQWSEIMSPAECARLYRVSPRTFLRHVKTAHIRAKKISSKAYRIDKRDLP
jgi:DNA-binding CsgD family transcriptional regulator